MHLNLLTATVLIAGASAYPGVVSKVERAKGTSNAGFFPNKEFNAKDQYVDVRPGSGHEFVAPGKHDVRGPCPGLNAAANHGFTSHTGVNDYKDTTSGLHQAFALGEDFSNILFVFSVFNSGSLIDMAWSIGGPFKSTTINGLLGGGKGLSNSHNKYEGDASTGRGDAYLHGGDAHSLVIGNYENILKQTKQSGGNFDMEAMRRHLSYSHEYTIKHNPYGFFGPGFFVSPIAHEFVTAFMSNHSAHNIQGELPEHVLNSFFAVKKNKAGKYEWIRGHDRIPDNWYRRPSSNPYGVAAAFGDLGRSIQQNPAIADVGGNMGKPNSYAGIEIEDLTSGVFNLPELTQGSNLQCFALQGLTIGIPEFATALMKKGTPFANLGNKILGGALAKANCKPLTSGQYKKKKFQKYPGWAWQQPEQPATPY